MADARALKTKIIFAANAYEEAVAEAAEAIRNGGIVVIPTETVYGLAANALDEAAVRKIFAAKGRPQDNPLIVHVSDFDMVKLAAAEIPACAQKLMDAYWPGPLSLVLEKTGRIPDVVSAGLPTVAVRMPDHLLTREIIARAGVPVAAPSANVSGRPSPTAARHAYEDLCGRVPLIIDGGPCGVGVESTVVDVTAGSPVILRPGAVTPEMIRAVCGGVALHSGLDEEGQAADAPPSPGMKYAHYAPDARVLLFSGDKIEVAKRVNSMYDLYEENSEKPLILCADDFAPLYAGRDARPLGAGMRAVQAALFAALRQADEAGYTVILFHYTDDMGLAVQNRIAKAAVQSFVF